MKLLLWSIILSLATTQVFAEALRDPTRPEFLNNKNNVVTGPLELNAIILSPNRQVAVINGTVVKVGDEIGDAKVISIAPNTVQLDGVGGKITLFLLDKSLKQPVPMRD